jgi:DNA-binding beta-propeller fold protein YncE
MPDILGSGEFRYRVDTTWGNLPDGWSLGDVAAVGIGARDEVYLFNRGAHPMIVLDRDGNFLRSWGEGVFKNPHGVHVGPDEHLYCTDDGDHTVRKCTPDGRVVLTIGVPGRAALEMSGLPFCRCTHTALSPEGDIYVADGYGNASVHKYAPDGRLLFSWGNSGTDPGCFNIVHNICCDCDGLVYVADRENHRVQVFNGRGRYEGQWNNLHRPSGLYMDQKPNALCYVGELGPFMALNRDHPGLGPRISVLSHDGSLLARFGDNGPGHQVGQFLAPHGLAVDSHGDLYVGEVANTAWPLIYPDEPRPAGLRVLRKLVRVLEN